MTNFSWAPNYRPKADAQAVGDELERIRLRDGGITVDAMLEEARPEEAPLHPLCTWDDKTAAENWRKQELRQAARSLVVITPERDPYRAYAHVANPAPTQQGYYQRTEIAVSNLNEYESVFRSASMRLAEAQRAMAELKRIAESNQSAKSVRRNAVVRADQALTKASEELAKAS
jgi:hypothetical protein